MTAGIRMTHGLRITLAECCHERGAAMREELCTIACLTMCEFIFLVSLAGQRYRG